MSVYPLFIFKRKIEDLFIRLFVGLGRDIARKKPLNEEYDIFFFFPFYHTGGAEKVHALIANTFRNKKCVIFFTRHSHNDGFKELFQLSGHKVLDISAYTDNKKQYWKNLTWRGVISHHINNQQKRPVIFNGQCNFAYKISPWINKKIPQIELIHSFNSFSRIRIPFIFFYVNTVMISRKAISDHKLQYEKTGIPSRYLSNIVFILNGIVLPPPDFQKGKAGPTLEVLYAGRATPEKRADLAARIAMAMKQNNRAVQFSFAGDIIPYIDESLKEAGIFYGNIDDPGKMNMLYLKSDILIITSSEEGFPMVVMEAMAHGCIIISTPVGDIPYHVKNRVNGFILSSSSDETVILNETLEYINELLNDMELRSKISFTNMKYARENFSIERFAGEYQQLFDTLNQTH